MWPLLLVLAGFSVGVAVTVMAYEMSDGGRPVGAARAGTTPAPILAPLASASLVLPPRPTPTAAAVSRPARCVGIENRLAQLVRDVDAAMVDYPGTWGFAIVDVACAATASFPAAYVQYPASAAKIVPVVTALRGVARGEIEFESVAGDVELVMTISSDESADYLASLVTEEEVAEVLAVAGVSELTSFVHDWEQAFMTPADLAAVWAGLIRGDLLPPEQLAYLLDLAGRAVIPEGYQTFPVDPGVEGYEYGQKAGFWVSDEEPDVLVGAGFLRSRSEGSGFALVLMVKTEAGEELEEKRHDVFPLLRDFVIAETGPSR